MVDNSLGLAGHMLSLQSVAAAHAVRRPTPTTGTAAASLSRRGRCSGGRPARLSVVSGALGDCKRTGIVEQLPSGGFTVCALLYEDSPSAASLLVVVAAASKPKP